MFTYTDGGSATTALTASKKRKRCSAQAQPSKCEVPLEERLREVLASASKTYGDNGRIIPSKLEELIVLLVKGLHTSDSKLVDEVLKTNNLETAKSVIHRLPVHCFLPLVRELTKRMRSKIDVRTEIRWLHLLLSKHSTYLSTVPEIVQELCAQRHLFESCVSMMDRFLRLQGRLNMILERCTKNGQPHQPRQLYPKTANTVFIDEYDRNSKEAADGVGNSSVSPASKRRKPKRKLKAKAQQSEANEKSTGQKKPATDADNDDFLYGQINEDTIDEKDEQGLFSYNGERMDEDDEDYIKEYLANGINGVDDFEDDPEETDSDTFD